MNLAGAPLAAVSPAVRDYRLLTRMGFDLTAAADEGLDVAQTLLLPLEGGALPSDSSTPGITTSDIQQAQGVLAEASARIDDALAAYAAIDVHALPGILQPAGKYGKYFALLPTAKGALSELNTLLPGAAALLGVGSPAYYLVVLMDRSELRPGGGFQGNYGILTIEGGKQSAKTLGTSTPWTGWTPPISIRNPYLRDRRTVARISTSRRSITGGGRTHQR